jgi:hypothetical protein
MDGTFFQQVIARRLFLTSVVLGLLCVAFGTGPVVGELRVGIAKTDITPPLGTAMAGYYTPRGATGVHDELFVRAMVLDDGTTKLILVILDNIRPYEKGYAAARKQIGEELKIPVDNIIIGATHTHTGPRIEESYVKILSAKIVDAVRLAAGRLRPAIIRAGIGQEQSISFNRRFLMKDDTVKFNPGVLNPDIVKPMGPIDPEVGIFGCFSLDGAPTAVFVNFAMHLDTVGGTEICADYPYFIGEVLKAVLGRQTMVFFGLGCCGNLNHINVKQRENFPRFGKADQIGHVLAGEVIKCLPTLEQQQEPKLEAASEIVPLRIPEYTPREIEGARVSAAKESSNLASTPEIREAMKVLRVVARDGKPIEAEVQVFALGDMALVALPGEVFVELGLAIKERSPFKYTFVMENCTSAIGYVPNAPAFDQGAYEVEVSHIRPGEGEKLVEAAVNLLNKLDRR